MQSGESSLVTGSGSFEVSANTAEFLQDVEAPADHEQCEYQLESHMPGWVEERWPQTSSLASSWWQPLTLAHSTGARN